MFAINAVKHKIFVLFILWYQLIFCVFYYLLLSDVNLIYYIFIVFYFNC